MMGEQMDMTAERRFYLDALAKAQSGPESTGYGSAVSQQVRFQTFLRLWAQEASWPFTLLDYGCGTGDLLAFMDGAGYTSGMKYVGVDRLEEMIETCAKRYESDARRATGNVQFWWGDAIVRAAATKFDVTTAIGVFAFKDKNEDPVVTTNRILEEIERLIAVTSKLVFVTLWSRYADKLDPDDGTLAALDPATVFKFLKAKYDRVDLIHSYAPHDFAIAIYPEEGRWWRERSR